jgi:hypothetical protein
VESSQLPIPGPPHHSTLSSALISAKSEMKLLGLHAQLKHSPLPSNRAYYDALATYSSGGLFTPWSPVTASRHASRPSSSRPPSRPPGLSGRDFPRDIPRDIPSRPSSRQASRQASRPPGAPPGGMASHACLSCPHSALWPVALRHPNSRCVSRCSAARLIKY